MKRLLFSSIVVGFFVSLANASDPAEERFRHPSFTTEAPSHDAQLPPGNEPGTYRLATTCTVDFSRDADFPATIVLLDYAKKELFKQTVTSTKPFKLTYDLKPGTYEAVSKPATESRYWDTTGFVVHIDAGGILTHASYGGHDFESPTFWHRLKIEIISPKNLETIKGKTIVIGKDSYAETVIPGNQIVLKWKAVPGVKTYTVYGWRLENPFHPDSHRGERNLVKTTTTNELRLKEDDWLEIATGYKWIVMNGSEDDELHYGVNLGHFAFGESVFMTQGAIEYTKSYPDHSEEGDRWIDSQLGVRFRQCCDHSDGPPAYIIIQAIGSHSPAIQAGLHPQTRIFSINNTPVGTLDQLRAILSKTTPDKSLTIAIGEDAKHLKLFTLHQ